MSKPKRTVKSLDELKARAALALGSPALVKMAGSANSPTDAQELAYLETGDVKVAMSCQYLAAIKRDYGKGAFEQLVSSAVSTGPSQADRAKRKGEVMPKQGLAVQESVSPQEENQTSQQAKLPSIPLAGITYRATVNGAFARVRCIQHYTNDADRPVEAIYVFPLPDESAVVGCSMKIGDRRIEAVIKERKQARQEYDEAVSAGHHGALLEQERPNIFTMNVGGLEPGEDISVEITYVQRVRWQDGGGRFAIPLVVAPRFIAGEPQGKTGGGWSPDTDTIPDASRITPVVARDGVPYRANIQVLLTPGFWCELTSPSHAFAIGGGTGKQNVRKKEQLEIKAEGLTTDRDFILAYRSLLDLPEAAVHACAGKDENFGMVTVIPPFAARPVTSDIVLLLDVSGSMNGAKLAGLKVIAKKVLRQLMEQQLGHRVAVIAFESDVHPLGGGLQEISEGLISEIDKLEPMGGTQTGPALTYAFEQFPAGSERSRYILLVSDGQSDDPRYQGKGARIITAGIDTAVNDSTLRKLADKTGGAAQWFYPGEDFDRAANTLVGMLSGPVLRDISVEGAAEAVGSKDAFGGRPATLLIRQGKLPKQFVIKGRDPNGKIQSWEIALEEANDCEFLSQLWAREFLREEQDEKKQLEASLKYGVLCKHAAFVAISEKAVPGQKPIRVEVPVELPFTWDYDSVFGRGSVNLASLSTLGIVTGGGPAPRLRQMFSGGGGGRYTCCTRGGGGDLLGGHFMGAHVDSVDPMTFGSSGADDADLSAVESMLVEITDSGDSADRFSLDASDPLDRLVGILIAVVGGKFEEAQQAFYELKLTAKLARSWSPEQQAKANYFAIRLLAYGLKLPPDVMKILASASASTEADLWKELAKREMGMRSAAPVRPSYPEYDSFDGWEFMAWKLDLYPKPEIGPWAVVP